MVLFSFLQGTVLVYPIAILVTLLSPLRLTQVGCLAWSCASGPDLVSCQGGWKSVGGCWVFNWCWLPSCNAWWGPSLGWWIPFSSILNYNFSWMLYVGVSTLKSVVYSNSLIEVVCKYPVAVFFFIGATCHRSWKFKHHSSDLAKLEIKPWKSNRHIF